jgi:hypothetical protein
MAQNSAYTSVKIIPKALKMFSFRGRNLDYGGGKWETATTYLRNNHNCENIVVDPFNRSQEHNFAMLSKAEKDGIDSITCLNVLNVIKSANERETLLDILRMRSTINRIHHGTTPIIIIQVYEGDKTANADVQTCMKAKDYIPEIANSFPEWSIKRKGNVIIVFRAEHCRTWEHISHPYIAM